MIVLNRTLRAAASVTVLAVVVSLLGTAANAADAVRLAHHAVRNKILKEASDRYAVRFLSSHSDLISRFERRVTGTGRVARKGKRPQRFTYHTNVNTRNNSDKDTGYDIL